MTPALNTPVRDRRDVALIRAAAALHDAALQIKYLHWKFQKTATGEATLARIQAAIADIATLREGDR
jgi:hypothetical protein